MPTNDLAEVIARTRADLLALADRVEREEPSQELQIAIARHLGWTWHHHRDVSYWLGPDKSCWDDLPDWLHSLDAAASLEKPGWFITIERDCGRVDVSVVDYHGDLADDNGIEEHGSAPTEPRARTAAALRARAQEMGDE